MSRDLARAVRRGMVPGAVTNVALVVYGVMRHARPQGVHLNVRATRPA